MHRSAGFRTAFVLTAVVGTGAAIQIATSGGRDAAGASVALQSLPPGAAEAEARLAASPRHGEWQVIRSGNDSIRAWVVYPERSDPAPVVLVVHEIFGLSHWIRGVADQLAADGFVAIAPDLLTMNSIPTGPDGAPDPETARQEIRTLERADVDRWLSAVAEWGMALPAASDSYGIVGFCWGGSTSFAHAVAAPGLDASVVYYGGSPEVGQYTSIQAPVLGLYGGDDERVNATIPRADSAMTTLGKTYEPHIFEGAGHGFLRQQDGRDGANMRATQQAWPLTVQWFRTHLGN